MIITKKKIHQQTTLMYAKYVFKSFANTVHGEILPNWKFR